MFIHTLYFVVSMSAFSLRDALISVGGLAVLGPVGRLPLGSDRLAASQRERWCRATRATYRRAQSGAHNRGTPSCLTWGKPAPVILRGTQNSNTTVKAQQQNSKHKHVTFFFKMRVPQRGC